MIIYVVDCPLNIGIWLLVILHNMKSRILISVFTNRISKAVTELFTDSFCRSTLIGD